MKVEGRPRKGFNGEEERRWSTAGGKEEKKGGWDGARRERRGKQNEMRDY